ncbi:TonB-dependent receptor [Chitinophaga sancti]|uniref:TonB-dependent receptor n=1 Tax=Chitinophaga sancti TaxID=1004 RepID=A0A1K1SE75_9BACT|nr:TonB-dependent receptor [Chitinophaga sancti]WQD60004.1 TonB-dependent receptor [Chitinophaga sancti]WQG87866.1 TonB-dependent receptor [Chitinophaga sancti]SFW82689.1 TonB-dependent Receptor Plug Domain [Chitinophaga sancti]
MQNTRRPVRVIYLWLLTILLPLLAQAQLNGSYIISGKISGDNKEPLAGASVQIKGTSFGAITDTTGAFQLTANTKFPFKLVIRLIGYQPQEFDVKNSDSRLQIQLVTQNLLVNEVVVSASRQQEKLMKSPVAIEKLDVKALKETPAASFYDAIGNLKGVQMTTAGLTFKVFNTRGFNVPNNFRFMQLVDGVDNQAATLGVPLGNAIGPTELDIQSIEVTPGASSALYGMNAINGMSNLITRNPFQYQGISVYQKIGANHFDGSGGNPKALTETSVRYAQAFKDKFAFKINFSYMQGTDWYADSHNDFNPGTKANPDFPTLVGANNVANDAWNKYADQSTFPITDKNGKAYNVSRTGYWEKDLVGDYTVRNLKFDGGLYYKITPKVQLSYNYRVGKMDGFFQRGNRIGLKNVVVQNHKIELQGQDFTIRSYMSLENTGDSYNMNPLADNLEKSFKTDKVWQADYTKALNGALDEGADIAAAHRAARTAADNGRWTPGTAAFDKQLALIKSINDWDIYPTSKDSTNKSGGAALLQMSHFYHAEGTWNLRKYVHFADVLVGADYRTYEIIPDGNNFVDFTKALADRNTPGGKHIWYGKAGGFVQGSKTFFHDQLKLTASVRYDKSQQFEGKFNPRIAVVYTTPNQRHNFRASWQNGFRFPSLFEAYSFVNNGGVRRVGGLAFIEDGLGYFKNSYLTSSATAFTTAVNKITNADPTVTRAEAEAQSAGVLKVANLDPIKPEQIHSFEAGYKSVLFENKVFVDVDAYFNSYKNFIGQVEVAVPKTGNVNEPTQSVLNQMYDKQYQNRYRVWTNSKSTVQNYGFALGVTYNFEKGYTLSGNLNYNNLTQDKTKDDALIPGFNTPKYFTNVSFGNRQVFKNVGFNVVWHWQDTFYWQNLFGNGDVPAYSTVDAQVTYGLPKIHTSVKVGGSNIFNSAYFQYVGGPTIKGLYYVAITYDLPFAKK